MTNPTDNHNLLTEIVDRVNLGVFAIDREFKVVMWNRFMEIYSGHKASDIINKDLFEAFPELPESWLKRKIENVFVLKNFSFTSWEHRSYLFKFPHNRPITGNANEMRQNATFLPIRDQQGEIEHVCVTLADVTDTSTYETMLKEAVKSLAEASNRDGLTGIYNRRFLQQMLEKEVSRTIRYGGKLAFVLIDLDHFKNINDDHGHLAGDEALRYTAHTLQTMARNVDIFGRYGGEEFAFVLPETDLNGAKVFAERARKLLAEKPCLFGELKLPLTASIGVAILDEEMEKPDDLIAAADLVLYTAKDNGRNQVQVFNREVSTPAEASTKTQKLSGNNETYVNTITVGHK